jgi:hypothetical protein
VDETNGAKKPSEEKKFEWTETPFGGVICGVLLLGVIAALIIIYPPENTTTSEQK